MTPDAVPQGSAQQGNSPAFEDPDSGIWWLNIKIWTPKGGWYSGLIGPFESQEEAGAAWIYARYGQIHSANV